MADEDEIYGAEDHEAFEADDFDQDFVDGGIRDDVSEDHFSWHALYCFLA